MADPVTIDSPFKAAPTISFQGFKTILERAKSPFVSEADAIYHAIVAYGHDPARWLGIAFKEHNFGTNMNSVYGRNDTKSWTNARSVRHPDVKKTAKIITDPVRKSNYVKYASVLDSVLDGLYRVDEAGYAYDGKTTIKEVIAVWAPAEDANNPEGYAQTIAKLVNEWSKEFPVSEVPMAVPTQADIGFPVQVVWAADKGPWRPLQDVKWFVVHCTEGWWPSDRDYLAAATPPVASSHVVVAPDGTLAFEVPLDITAWTAGNDYVSRHSIQVEISGFASKGFTDAQYKSVARFFVWCKNQGVNVPFEYVGKENINGKPGLISHADVPNPNQPGKWGGHSGHTDPGPLFSYEKLIAEMKTVLDPVPVNEVRYFDSTQHYLAHGFRGFWESYGERALPTFGFPISEEFTDANGITVQWFERARFEHQPDIAGNPWGVVLGLIGNESRAIDEAHNPDAFAPKPPPGR